MPIPKTQQLPDNKEIIAMYTNPFYLELLVFEILSPDALSDIDKSDIKERTLPFLDGLARRFESEQNSLSELMVVFGSWIMSYYIPSPELFDRYTSLETIYQVMKDKLNPRLVAIREEQRTR